MNKRLIKILRYEFWPMWLFYAPFVPYWLWKSTQSRSLTYFCRANPGIQFGGFLDYSKYDILKQIPEEYRPKTIFISHKNQLEVLPDFPFVVKPDIGERGVNVEVIRDEKALENYPIENDLIIQEFIDFPLEFGVFYAKFPGEKNGKILSITGKKFLKFESDGKTMLRDFINRHARAYFRKEYLYKKLENQLDTIYPEGTQILLEPIGNHNRGTLFFDASDSISDELNQAINTIANLIEGFYYGRFDVKSRSVEDFQKGKFIVLEVNGSNSEATHIYDPKFNLLKAYREVKRHLDVQYQISKRNQKCFSDREFFNAVWKRIRIQAKCQ